MTARPGSSKMSGWRAFSKDGRYAGVMGYLLLILVALMWSFVGVLVKSASFLVDSSIITFDRFLLGVVFLYLLTLLLKRKPGLSWKDKWIWIGAVGKSCNYIFENLAISHGHAYGNILVWPIQTILIALVAILFFREEMFPRKGAALGLCLVGILLVSFKGESLSVFLKAGYLPLVLFALAALGSGIHLISLKKLIGKMDSINMNLSIFLICILFVSFPLPVSARITGNFNVWAVLSLVGLGLISGLSFYWNAEALKKVPFLSATLISNLCILFTPFWAWLFFREEINGYIIAGAVVLVIGIILANLPRSVSLSTLAGWRPNTGTEKSEPK